MLDEFLKTLYLIFFVAVNVSEQGVLPKSGLLNPYKNDLQEGGDMEVVIPPDCFEMCDEAGCVIYCPEPARGVKRCTAKSPLNKRFCCATDGPIAPIFNLPPQPVGTLPPEPLIPTYPSLLKPQKKLPGLTPLLDSKLTEIKNNLNKLKSLRTNLFRRKKSEGQNYIKSNPCVENHQSTSNEEREKCRDPVHLTDPSVLLPKPLKNVKEIILPNYDQKEISTSEIDSITNPERDSDLDEDHLNFKTSTRILDQNNLQIQSLNTRKYLQPDTAFQTSEHILHNINNNDPNDSTAILHPSSDINILLNSKDGNNISLLLPEIKNVHESTTNNNEIISVTESLPLAFQSDPHVFEPIYTEDSTPLKKYEHTFLNDATINKLNYVNFRTDSQEYEPKLSNKNAQENTINLINEEKTKLPIQNESEYENNEYKTVYSKDLLDAPLHSKFINTESITNEQIPFNKPENVIMGTVHDNDSTMINVPTNADENILVNVPKSNFPENISNEFEALYFDDNVAGREKLLIPLSQVLGNVKSHNTQIKEIHSQVTDGQETQGYQNFQPYRSNDQQKFDSEIGEKHPQQTENIWLDYLPIEPSKKKELSSHDTTYYEEHPRDIGTKDAHDEKSNIAYLQKTYEGKRGVKHDVENIKYTILKEEPHNVPKDEKFIADDPLLKHSNNDNKEKSESQEVTDKSDTAQTTRPLSSESITDDVNLYSKINDEQSIESGDVYGLENDGRRRVEHTHLPNNLKSITEVPLFKYSISNYEKNSEHKNVNYNSDTGEYIHSPNAELINDEARLHTDIDGQQIIEPSEANVVENKKNSIETFSRMNGEHKYEDNIVKLDSEEKINQLKLESINDGKNSYATIGTLHSAVANDDYGVKNDKKYFGTSEMSDEIPRSFLQGELPFAKIEDILFNFSKSNKKDKVNVYSDIVGEQSELHGDIIGVDNKRDSMETFGKNSEEHGNLRQNVKPLGEYPMFNIPTRSNKEDTHQKEVISNSVSPPTISLLPPQISKSINDEVNVYSETYGDQPVMPSDINGVENITDAIETFSRQSEEHVSHRQDLNLISEHPLFNIPARSNNKDSEEKHVISNSENLLSISLLPPQISESINDKVNLYNDMDRVQSVLPIDAIGEGNQSDVSHTSGRNSGEQGSLRQDVELITEHPLFTIPPRSNGEDTMQKHVISNSDTPPTISPLPPQISESINDEVNVFSDINGVQPVMPSDINVVANITDAIETFGKHSGEHGSLRQDVEFITEHPMFNIPTRSNEEDTMQKHVISNSDTPPTISPLPPLISGSINDEVNVYNDIDRDQSVLPIDGMGVDNLSDVTHTSVKYSGEHGSLGQDADLITEHPLFNIPALSNEEDTIQKHVISNSDTPSNITLLPSQTSESINYDINVYNDMDRDQSVLPIDAMGVNNLSDVTHTSVKYSGEHGSLGQDADLITEHPLFNIPALSNEEDTIQKHVISNSDTPPTISPLPPLISESINDEINVYNDMDRDQSVLPIDAMGVDNLSDVTHTSVKYSGEHGSLGQDAELITEHPLFNIPTRSNEEDTMQKHVISNSDTPSNITPLPSQTSESINYDINVYNDMDRDQSVLPIDAMDRDQSVLPIDAMGVDNLSDVTHTSGKHSKEHDILRQDVELITEHPLFTIPPRSNEEDTMQKHVISNSDTPPTISTVPPQISESINDEVNVYNDIDRDQSVLPIDAMGVDNLIDVTHTSGKHSKEHGILRQDVELITEHPLFTIPPRSNEEDTMQKHVISNSDTPPTISTVPPQISESINDEVNVYNDIDRDQSVLPIDAMGVDNLIDVTHTSGKHSKEHGILRQDVELITEHPLFNIPPRSKEEDTMQKHVISNSDTPSTISPLPLQISEPINNIPNHSNKIKYENEHASDKLNSAPYDRVIDQPVLPSNIYGEKSNSDTIEYSGFTQNIRSTRGQSLLKVSNSSNVANTLTEDEHDKSEIANIIHPHMSESYNDVGEILYGTLHGEKTGLHSDDYHVENHQNTFGTSDRHSGEYTSLSHDVNPIFNHPILNFLNNGNKNNYMNEEVIDKSYTSSLPSLISELNNDKVNFSDVNEEQLIMPSDFFGVENKRNTIEKFARDSEKPASFSQIVNPVNEHPLFNIPNRSNKNNSNNEDSFNKSNIPATISQLISDSSNDKEVLYSTIVGDQAITNEKNFITDKYFIPMGNIHKEETDFKIPKISPNMYPQKRGISQDKDEISNQFISNVEKLKIERQNEQQDLSLVHNPTNNEVHSNTHIEQQASSGFGVTSVKNRGQDVSFDSSDRKKVDEEDQNVFNSYNNAPLLNALEGIPSINVEKSIKYSPEIDDHTYGSSHLNFYNKLYEFNNSTNSNNSQGTTNNEYVNKSVFMEKINDHEENADVESFQFSQHPKNVDTTRKSESEAYNLSMSHMDDVRPDIIVADLTQDINVNNQEYLNNENVLNNVHTKKLEANIHDEDSLVDIPVLSKPVESETCSCKSESSTFNFPEESSRGLLIGNLINRMNPRSPIHIFIDGDSGIITPERVSFPSKSKLSNTKIDHVISERNIESPKKPYDFVNGQYVRMKDNEYNNLNENNNQELLEPRSAPKHLSYETSPEHLLTPELRESITSDGISTFLNQQQIKNQGQYISQPNEFYTNHPSSSETGYYTPVPIYIYIRSK